MASKRPKFRGGDTTSETRPPPTSPSSSQTRDIGVQVSLTKDSSLTTLRAFMLLALAAVITVVLFPVIVDHFRNLADLMAPRNAGFRVSPDVLDDIGMEGVVLFKQHDRDDDDYLSIEEFEPLAHRLMDINETYVYDQAIDEIDEVFTVELKFEPLQLDTMTKDNDSTGKLDSLMGLKHWKTPQLEWKNFGAGQFQRFLPHDPALLDRPGEVYWLIEGHSDLKGGPPLSGNRYNPPMLMEETEIMIHRLLAMVHPRPFVLSRFAPHGSVACVRAYNDKFVSISFRIHAEFQLNDPPFYPFWFTPAQFAGNIILEKSSHKLAYFHMKVPNKQLLNVDMEWLHNIRQDAEMEVDIGYMPRMEWTSTRASLPAFYGNRDMRDQYIGPTNDYQASIDAIKWTKEIPETEARRNLEVILYPFKEVPYYNFSEVFHEASLQKKPVHSILLWGALDDQSC